MDWLTASGRICYNPVRPGGKKRVDADWIIVEVDPGIVDYYRWWVERMVLSPPWAVRGLRLQPPLWGAHITVLDGRRAVPEPYRHRWGERDGQRVEFQYSPAVERHWKFWSLPVRGTALTEIRQDYGFWNAYPYHITVGRLP